ncbi:MAG: hypothetical protein QNI99_04340 [Woeseiaceae bacterium]|nr:hypothetical protein [Woeseiaceae bacterium]
MQDARAPETAASKGSLTATAALLLFLSAPVLAATGLDVICDENADRIDHLTIDTIDHPLTSRITGESEIGGGEEQEPELLPVAVREQEILRRIFDEPVTKVEEELPSSSDASAEVETPIIEERSADVAETDTADRDARDSLLPGIRLPDATPEETRRYRRQMFRTDI